MSPRPANQANQGIPAIVAEPARRFQVPMHVLCVIPLYNHASTIREVAERALREVRDVLVVDDGSTDGGCDRLAGLPVEVLRLSRNRGKGRALREAAAWALERGFTHMIALDADGQHFPEDIPLLIGRAGDNPHALVIGARNFDTANVPFSSRFGRSFSAFWMFVQTGEKVGDMQSGFRLYPLAIFRKLTFLENRYSFEIEVVVKSVWAGFPVTEVPVRVHYPVPEKRISHFDGLWDNVKISLLNTRLTIRALLPVPFTRRVPMEAERREKETATGMDGALRMPCSGKDGESAAPGGLSLFRPLEAMRALLEKDVPRRLALSAGLAVAIACLPIFGLQVIVLLACINGLGLNRVCALLFFVPLTWIPVLPAAAIVVGQLILHGTLRLSLAWETLGADLFAYLKEWVLGSLVLAPAAGLAAGAATCLFARVVASLMGGTGGIGGTGREREKTPEGGQ